MTCPAWWAASVVKDPWVGARPSAYFQPGLYQQANLVGRGEQSVAPTPHHRAKGSLALGP